MSADLGTWLRVKPSGHVHYVVGVSTGGTRWLACGIRSHRDRLTDDYSPAARRCIECEDARDPEDEEVL